MSKSSTLLLITVLVLSSLAMFGSALAQPIPEPSVPEFTIRFVNASYTVTNINSYTGLEETELVSNDSIEITVDNQPFDYSNFQLYYNIRVKPHFENDWIEVYPVRNRTRSYNEDGTFSYSQYVNDDSVPQSNSSFTIVTFPVVPTELYSASGYDIESYHSEAGSQEGEYFAFLSAVPVGGQVDFQVEAAVGHYAQVYVNDHPLAPYPIGHYEQSVAFDVTSGWSITQTMTIAAASVTPRPSTVPSPSSSETSPSPTSTAEPFPAVPVLAASAIVVMVAAAWLMLHQKKHKRSQNS